MPQIYVAEDISRDYVFSETYHLSIFASGYEERSVNFAALINKRQILKPIVFGFLERSSDPIRLINDELYKKLGYRVETLDGNYEAEIYRILGDSLKEFSSTRTPLKILIDYSSMPRTWYSSILNFFRHFEVDAELHFVYSVGEHAQPATEKTFDMPVCLPGCDSSYVNSRKRVAIFGLGFDEMAPVMLYDKLEPDEAFALIARPSALPNYAEKTAGINRWFIENCVGRSNRIIYSPIFSVQTTFQTLLEVALPYFESSTITILPFGPKPHVLASILMAINFGPVSCLYSASHGRGGSVTPNGELVITSVKLTELQR